METCLKNYYKGETPPERENLSFIIGLRNQIEHRHFPALDFNIYGECQALLINYEKALTSHFGKELSLNGTLAIPLQMISVNPEWKIKALKELQRKEYNNIKEFINTFRENLAEDIWKSEDYSFRVFLIPKIGNRNKSSDIAVEFVPYDPSKPDEMKKYEKITTLIKDKKVPVQNKGYLKAGEVAKKVKEGLGIEVFHPSLQHVCCWRYYKVRPETQSDSPEKTTSKYCIYDEAHNDYIYTKECVKYLLDKCSSSKRGGRGNTKPLTPP